MILVDEMVCVLLGTKVLEGATAFIFWVDISTLKITGSSEMLLALY